MAKKEFKGFVKLVAPANQANPSPPIGPILGSNGVNIAEFCKQFNDATKDLEAGTPIPVIITVYTDRSFEFITKLPPVSFYIKKALGLKWARKTLDAKARELFRRLRFAKSPKTNCLI